MLAGLQPLKRGCDVAVEVHEEGVGAPSHHGHARHSDRVVEGARTFSPDPEQGRCGELVAWHVISAAGRNDSLDQSADLQGVQEVEDDPLPVVQSQTPQRFGEGAATAQVLPEPAACRQINIAPIVIPPLSRTREEDGGVFHCEGFVLVDGPRLDQPLTALLKQVLLVRGVQVVHLDRQLPAHVVQQYPADLLPHLRAGELQGWMAISPYIRILADILQRKVAEFQQAALFQVGRGNTPAALEVAVQPIAQHASQGPLRLRERLKPGGRIARVHLHRQI